MTKKKQAVRLNCQFCHVEFEAVQFRKHCQRKCLDAQRTRERAAAREALKAATPRQCAEPGCDTDIRHLDGRSVRCAPCQKDRARTRKRRSPEARAARNARRRARRAGLPVPDKRRSVKDLEEESLRELRKNLAAWRKEGA